MNIHLRKFSYPYSNGICSMSQLQKVVSQSLSRLNPYSNGICSTRVREFVVVCEFRSVLILILMEYAL